MILWNITNDTAWIVYWSHWNVKFIPLALHAFSSIHPSIHRFNILLQQKFHTFYFLLFHFFILSSQHLLKLWNHETWLDSDIHIYIYSTSTLVGVGIFNFKKSFHDFVMLLHFFRWIIGAFERNWIKINAYFGMSDIS